MASVNAAGVPADTGVAYLSASLSGDGRFVAFSSDATNLVHGITGRAYHVYVRDRQAGETALVDVDADGSPTDGGSVVSRGSISSDGRFVAFASNSATLVTGDTNGVTDVFVRDRSTGETTRVSVDSLGAQANRESYSACISGDGRFVAFSSGASNLVPGDTNGCVDVFVHDRATRRTIRVSVDSTGAQARFASTNASISADGRFVAFDSAASNLVAGDANDQRDVFVHDLTTGRTERASVNSNGGEATFGWNGYIGGSIFPAISGDGRFVAFLSDAAHLDLRYYVFGLTGYFVHDRLTGSTTRVSVSSAGIPANPISIYPIYPPAISADGRYVAFACRDGTLDNGDDNLTLDVFVHDLRTRETLLQSRSSSGVVGDGASNDPALSADGSVIVFMSGSTNLVDPPTSMAQVFARGRLARDVIETYCYGDGTTVAICPCFNFGASRRGCASSQVAEGAKFVGTGRPSTNTVVLTASSLPSSALTVIYEGSSSDDAGVVFGDGVRCAAGTLTRLYTRTADGGSASAPGIGEPAIPDRSAQLGDPIAAGELRFYQAYYRDPDSSFCTGSGFNVTNAVLVGW